MSTTAGEILRYDLPDTVSACMIPEKSPLHAEGPGDAVLAAPSCGVLAVADSPDGNPGAAGKFLELFCTSFRDAGLTGGNGLLRPDAFNELASLTGRLAAEISYDCSSTFSCVVLTGPRTAGLLHTGDSFIFCARTRNDIEQLSRTNHFMIGRSPGLFQTEIVALPSDCLLLLATDGLAELAGSLGLSIRDFLSRHFSLKSPADLIQGLIEISSKAGKRLDDLGAVAAVPSRMAGLGTEAAAPALLKMQHTKYNEVQGGTRHVTARKYL